jgi:hypothetical protein
MFGHQAAPKALVTSRLTSTMTSPAFKPSSTEFFTAIAASMVLLCGVNPYWLLIKDWWSMYVCMYACMYESGCIRGRGAHAEVPSCKGIEYTTQ